MWFESCSFDDPEGIDLLCDWRAQLSCAVTVQDCPDGEKCIARALDEDGLFPVMCVPVEGTDMIGEPCTGLGDPDYTDSCDRHGMCWSGELGPAPHAGVCFEFCDQFADPTCPIGSTCELVADGLELCVPG
jgi:hypothetical protein